MAAFTGFRLDVVFPISVGTNYNFALTGGKNLNTTYYSLSGCAFIAALVQTALAASKLRLYKSTLSAPTPATTLSAYVTAEADFTGYPAGGATLATWLAPILSPTSGYQIQAPMTQFATSNPTTVGNIVGGWFLVETGGALIAGGAFGTPIPMQSPGQGFDLAPVVGIPTGV